MTQDTTFSLERKISELLEELTSLKTDASKFDRKNGAAGRRVRLVLAKLRNDMQSLRFDIQQEKNQRKLSKKSPS